MTLALRRHQAEARDALRAAHEAGHDRTWVVLPPGAGKTVLGVDHALWLGRTTVVFCPNTAIVGQWIDTWDRLRPEGVGAAGDDRELSGDCTVLTYQSLAVFDAESDAPGIARLHENGRALVERLRQAGPLAIVLDECHHLLQVWGSLLDELLGELEAECVLALTATPPETLNPAEAALIGRLFGPVTYAASLPSVVGAGDLVPFVELAWPTSPTPTESAWLDARTQRVAEFVGVVTDPSLTDVGLLSWLDLRFVDPRASSGVPGRRWADVERTDPALADAVIRLARAGHCALPAEAVVGERHRHPASVEDWLAVLDDWLRHHVDERDPALAERVRAGLPAIGFRATRAGIRPGPSLVDRVLGRSESKAQGAVEIVAHTLGHGDPRLLILCDHATAATLPADLAGVLPATAGSARRMLELLLEDARTAAARPVLVTGSTVAASVPVAEELLAFTVRGNPSLAGRIAVEAEPSAGLARLTGWTSKQWTPAVTAFLEAGRTRCLIGTRALLGEGWDARGITGVIDAGTATTTAAIVQTRGRSLRVDPERPGKTAVNWTLTCIAPGRPQGDADWARLVRKHDGWFSVDEFGDVVDGVAHLDSRFSAFEPPPLADLPLLQARALRRSEDASATAESWARVGPDRAHPLTTLRVRGGVRDGADRLPVATGPGGALIARSGDGRAGLVAWLVGGALAAGASAWLAPVLVVPIVLAIVLGAGWSAIGTGRRRLGAASEQPSLTAYAAVIADALRAEGLSPAGAEGVHVEVTPDGEYRCRLDGVPEDVSALFVTALDELLAPIAAPRYLVPRWMTASRDGLADQLSAGVRGVRPDGAVWHQVPAAFGGTRAAADRFADAWNARVPGGRAVFTGSPEGRALMIAHRGASPVEGVTTVVRRQW